MKIGFIGLGRMGSGMAANLAKAGHDLTVFNRSAGKARPLIELGAQEASSIAEASRNRDVVITMLADDAAVEAATLAASGMVADLPKGAIHISMSTISVALSKKLAQAHAQAGQRYISAPVFGRPEVAAQAKLFIIPAGDPATIEACRPLFDVLGQKTIPMGTEPAAANLVKLSGNFLLAALIESLGEALALVGKGGIDRQAYIDFLTETLFPVPIYKNYGSLIAQRKFQPAGFAAPLGYKDVRLVLAAAEELKVPLPLGSLMRDRFLRLLAQGGAEDLDWCAAGDLPSQDAAERRN